VQQTASPPPPPSKRPATEPFKALLEEARQQARTPPGLTRKPPAAAPLAKAPSPTSAGEAFAPVTVAAGRGVAASSAVASQHAATAQQLSTTRAHHAATSEQLATTRLAHHETHEHQQATRVIDLIVKELISEFEPRASSKLGNPVQPVAPCEVPFPVEARAVSAASPPAASPASGPSIASAEARAAQAVALIERIETFVKSTRPALAMTLNNSLGARVELEKLGPGRIALRLVGQNGPPTPETVSRIRDELRARGLEVGALSVA
jgi:hypothetical protein